MSGRNFQEAGVRSYAGTPPAATFVGSAGTPIICDITPGVGLAYFLDSAGAVQTLGAGGGGGAPTNATYLTLSLNGSLTSERVLTAGTGISFVDTGANGTLTINASATAQSFARTFLFMGA